jgi:predicted amidohydrolase YtcJ
MDRSLSARRIALRINISIREVAWYQDRMKLSLIFLFICSLAFSKTIHYTNAKILTDFTKKDVFASELLVADGKITHIGTELSAPEGTPKVDLEGRYILPALTDAHAHLIDIGKEKFEVDLRGSRSPEEVVRKVRAFLKKEKPKKGSLISGNGWDQSDWPGKSFPHRTLLDQISNTQPIVLYRVDGHAAWTNTKALQLSGIWEKREDPKGGKVIRDKRNEPTGILIDEAMNPLGSLRWELTPNEIERFVKVAVERALSLGIVSIHDAGLAPEHVGILRKMLVDKKLSFRFYEMLSAGDDKALEKALNAGPIIDAENDRLTVRTVKLYADGAMGSRGAAFDLPYNDDAANSGLLMMTSEEMEKAFRRIDSKGFQIAVHAIGSKANRLVIDALQKALGSDIAKKRPRLEHAQVLTKEDIDRIGKLGIIASMQPIHATSDMKWVVDRIGKERARYSYAWKSLLKTGSPLAFGSDAPVEALNPWPGLYAAVTRKNAEQKPEGAFFPEERVSLPDAFRAFTEGAAFAAFQESKMGSLTPGKWADFIALSKNPFQGESKELLTVQVEATYLAGEKVWEKGRLP